MSFSFLFTTLVAFDLIVKQALIDNIFLLTYFKVDCIVLCSLRHWRLLWTVFLFYIPCSWWGQQEKLTSHSMSWLSGSCDLFLLLFLKGSWSQSTEWILSGLLQIAQEGEAARSCGLFSLDAVQSLSHGREDVCFRQLYLFCQQRKWLLHCYHPT